jgi:hypothetical protein
VLGAVRREPGLASVLFDALSHGRLAIAAARDGLLNARSPPPEGSREQYSAPTVATMLNLVVAFRSAMQFKIVK